MVCTSKVFCTYISLFELAIEPDLVGLVKPFGAGDIIALKDRMFAGGGKKRDMKLLLVCVVVEVIGFSVGLEEREERGMSLGMKRFARGRREERAAQTIPVSTSTTDQFRELTVWSGGSQCQNLFNREGSGAGTYKSRRNHR